MMMMRQFQLLALVGIGFLSNNLITAHRHIRGEQRQRSVLKGQRRFLDGHNVTTSSLEDDGGDGAALSADQLIAVSGDSTAASAGSSAKSTSAGGSSAKSASTSSAKSATASSGSAKSAKSVTKKMMVKGSSRSMMGGMSNNKVSSSCRAR